MPLQDDAIPLIDPPRPYPYLPYTKHNMSTPGASPVIDLYPNDKDPKQYLGTRHSGTQVPLLKHTGSTGSVPFSAYNASPNMGGTMHRAYLQPLPPASPLISLWKEQLIAGIAGSITLLLGMLGVLAFAGFGPLSWIFIPAERLSGPIVNTANIGALVAGISTLFSAMGTIVITGVSRAWLRRQATKGYGPCIKEWRTLSAGVSFYNAIKTPYLARGLTLMFVLAVAAQNSIFAGVAIPGASTRVTAMNYVNIPQFSGNGGQGAFTSCIVANKKPCAQFAATADVMTAFQRAIWMDLTNSSYPVSATTVKSANANSFIGAAFPKPPSTNFATWTWDTPIATFNTICQLLPHTGIDNARDQFSIVSPCTSTQHLYGNLSADEQAFMYCDCCPDASPARQGINMTMSVAGWGVPDIVPNSTFGVGCNTVATESMGNATYVYGSDATVEPKSGADFIPLSQNDMLNLGTAVLGALKSSTGTDGIPTLTHATMVVAVDPNTGKIDLSRIAAGISNAFAAAAASGYTTQLNSGYQYSNVIASLPAYTIEEGFGWMRMSRLSGWSALCCLVGLLWLALALYMRGGGTRYDPSDWYQTLNTAAASSIQQKHGTCTGAHLKEHMVNSEHLWYGELAPGHVGFSQAPAPAVQPNVLYGEGQLR